MFLYKKEEYLLRKNQFTYIVGFENFFSPDLYFLHSFPKIYDYILTYIRHFILIFTAWRYNRFMIRDLY